MLSKFGIGARLFLAFLGITALSLSSGVAGWLILRDISDAQLRINSEAFPAVAAAQRTAETSERLVATAPALTAARDEISRAQQEKELLLLAAEIRNSVTDARLSTLDRELSARLYKTVDALVSNLSAQNQLVKERLELQHSFTERAERTIGAATAIVDLSETLVSNASAGASAVVSNLFSLIDDSSRHLEAYDALDRLIEQDIYLLDRMWELRLRSSQIGLLTNRLTRAIDPAEVTEIATGFEEHLRVVKRRVASIDDPVRRQQATEFFDTLEQTSGSAAVSASLFGDRLRLIAIGERLQAVAEDNRNLSTEVSQVAQLMLSNSQAFARDTSARAENAVNAGLYLLIVTSLVAVTLSGLIVWLYVERGVVRRLETLTGAMQRLTDGDLSVEVKPEGMPELRALSAAVVAFRDESQQRRTLEVERARTNEELRRHREELQELVSERTGQLQLEVKRHTEARERAETASLAKSDFLATMSHEIRTPMTGMLGMLRILGDAQLTAPQRKQLATAASSGEALLGILNSILDYSKIESGKISIDSVDFDLRSLLNGVVELMRPPAREKRLKLALAVDQAVAPYHHGDAGKLRQIIFNLVSNAIKFTLEGQVKIEVKVVDLVPTGQTIRIAVGDTGIGIPAEEQGHIFESFAQTDASITRRYGGTGLGLSISRGLAQALGGTLSVESEQEQGSTFTLELSLPVAVAALDATPARLQRKKSKSLNVLVVEDDEATRVVASQFLAGLGHRVVVAEDGYRGVSALAEERPDLVLMDISLPGLDGIATAAKMRAAAGGQWLPIIAMSAHVFKTEIDRYLAAGMDAYVAKPLTPEVLDEAIDQVLAARSSTPAMDHVDTQVLRDDLGALGQDAVLKILALVEQTLPKRFADMRTALGSGDFETLARLAHLTYSAAAAAGFVGLCETVLDLETAARSGIATENLTLIERCEYLYETAMTEARALVQGPQAERLMGAAKK